MVVTPAVEPTTNTVTMPETISDCATARATIRVRSWASPCPVVEILSVCVTTMPCQHTAGALPAFGCDDGRIVALCKRPLALEGTTMSAAKRLQVYATPGVTVTFDPNICQHTGICLRGLPAVFDIREKRWVRP